MIKNIFRVLTLILFSHFSMAAETNWFKVAVDNFGNVGQQSHLVTSDGDYRFPESSIPISVCSKDDSARTVAHSTSAIEFTYGGLDPEADYKLRLTFLSDKDNRVQSVFIDRKEVKGRFSLPKNKIVSMELRVPRSENRRVQISIKQLGGVNAVISSAELWSTRAKLKPDFMADLTYGTGRTISGIVRDRNTGRLQSGITVSAALRSKKSGPRVVSDAKGAFTLNLPSHWLTSRVDTVSLIFQGHGRMSMDRILISKLTEKMPPRISPLPLMVDGVKVLQKSLNGRWKFNSKPQTGFNKMDSANDWSDINVPGEWAMQGFKVPKYKAAGYFRTFTVPASWKGQRTKLRFESVYSECTIFMNGEKVGYHMGGLTSFELDVTKYVRFDQSNTLVLSVKSESASDTMIRGSHYAKHQVGGILRNVTLFALPTVNVSNIGIRTVLDEKFDNAILKLKLAVDNESLALSKNLSVKISMKPLGIKGIPFKGKSEVLGFVPIGNIDAGNQWVCDQSFSISSPQKWHAETPFLYQLQFDVMQGGKIIETVLERFGFRDIKIIGNQVFINGTTLKLRGVCRHSIHPLTGRTVSLDLIKKDIELFRKANCNFIRTSHYPPQKELLDLCDETGMFVMNEAPICWTNGGSHTSEYELIRQCTLEMYSRDKNHPSIIIWSQGNESGWSPNFERSVRLLKSLDPDRLVMFSHSEYYGIRGRGLLDIGTRHYPGYAGPAKYNNYFRPIIFDEFLHINAYNEREFLTDPGVRGMWGRYASDMWSSILKSRGSLGGAIWGGIDEVFFMPDGRRVGFGPWGIVDGFRREKPEYWGLKKAYSPIKIELKPYVIENDQLIVDVQNRYDLIDFSGLTINWSYGGHKGVVTSSLAAGNHGHLVVNLPKGISQKGVLGLEIIDHQGYPIDRYNLSVGVVKNEMPVTTKSTKNVMLRETKTEWVITGQDSEWCINKADGLITSGEFMKESVIKGGPYLMLMPLDNNKVRVINNIPILKDDTSDYSAFLSKHCAGWKCTSAVVTSQTSTEIKIKVTGSYKEANGFYIYAMRGDGTFDIKYSFIVKKDMSPRQLGIVLDCDNGFETLQWNRKGELSVYPKNHIDRLQGTAKAFYNAERYDVFGPRHKVDSDWKDDATIFGSNDFRSTKHNIYEAKLTNSKKLGLKVNSDSSQHIRCWIENNQTKMLIAYYSHAGAEYYFRNQVSKDTVKLVVKDHQENLVEDHVYFEFLKSAK